VVDQNYAAFSINQHGVHHFNSSINPYVDMLSHKRSDLTSCFFLKHHETHTNSKDESFGSHEDKG
jgi:hypothetical protein